MAKEIKDGGQSHVFDYKQVDEQMAEFLRRKESNMREIVGKAYTDLGRELKEAQQELAKAGYGCFLEWLDYIGMERRKAYRLIDRYKLVLDNLSKTDLLEDLPVSLTYEIAKPSAESTPAKAQAKSEVLAGDIDTLKAYKERIDFLEKQNEQLAKEADKPPETKYIEVDNTPHDYEEVKARLEEYRDKFGDIENYDEHITATHRQDMIVAVMSFSQGVREFIKRYDYMTKYKGVIDNLDDGSKRQYDEAVGALKGMAETFEFTTQDGIIINAEYSEIN